MADNQQQPQLLDNDTVQHILAAIHHGHHPLSQPGGPLGVQPQSSAPPVVPTGAVGKRKPGTAEQVGASLAPSIASKAASLIPGIGPVAGPIAGAATKLGTQAAEGTPVTGEDIAGAVGGAAGGAGGAVGGAAAGAAIGAPFLGVGAIVGAAAGALLGGALGGAAGEQGGAVQARVMGMGKAKAASGRGPSPFGGRYTPGASPFALPGAAG